MAAVYGGLFVELARTDRDNPVSFYILAASFSFAVATAAGWAAIQPRSDWFTRRTMLWLLLAAIQAVVSILVAASLAVDTVVIGLLLWGLSIAVWFVVQLGKRARGRPEQRELHEA